MVNEVITGPCQVLPVFDETYQDVVRQLANEAVYRFWASIFLVEVAPSIDPELAVPTVLRDVAGAHWRGVDTRLLIGGSRTNYAIAEASAVAMHMARGLGIPVKSLGTAGMRGSHVKLVIADDRVLVGSHNWSPGAFGDQVQDSVLIHSADLSAYLCQQFLRQWYRKPLTNTRR